VADGVKQSAATFATLTWPRCMSKPEPRLRLFTIHGAHTSSWTNGLTRY